MISLTEKVSRPRRRKEESGLVLLDVLFAVFVLGIAALYLVEARSNSITCALNTARLRIARMLASQKMEEVLVNELSQEPDENFASSGAFDEEGYPGFEYSIDSEDVSISTEEDLEDPEKTERFVRRLSVTVIYKGEGNKEEDFSLTTILPEIAQEDGGG